MVEGAALEKRCAGNGTEGSNPSLSARRRASLPSAGSFFSLKKKEHPGSVEQGHAQMFTSSMGGGLSVAQGRILTFSYVH